MNHLAQKRISEKEMAKLYREKTGQLWPGWKAVIKTPKTPLSVAPKPPKVLSKLQTMTPEELKADFAKYEAEEGIRNAINLKQAAGDAIVSIAMSVDDIIKETFRFIFAARPVEVKPVKKDKQPH